MLFNSWSYIMIYLLLGVSVFWLLPHRFRVYFVALASLCFYGLWRWDFLFLMIFSTTIDYVSARKIFATQNKTQKKIQSKRTRKAWLLFTLITNLGLLCFFKYTYFLWDNIAGVVSVFGIHLPDLKRDLGWNIVLPLGISFYTFHTISYTIDVYRGIVEPIRNYFVFLSYVAFWPLLVAGPILRAGEVIPQFLQRRKFNWVNISEGGQRVVLGLAKKTLLADMIAIRVDHAFSLSVYSMSSIDIWVAATLFGLQIYFDFSGYSDVALGSAQMMGFKFSDNFNWPYVSKSPKEFWKRWHISLSSWVRDYIYLPLNHAKVSGSKSSGGIAIATEVKKEQTLIPLFITWFIMGLWHGASWNFVCWGVFHACLIALYRVVPFFSRLERSKPFLSGCFMFAAVMVSWIFFRASTLHQAWSMIAAILNPTRYTLSNRSLQFYSYSLLPVLLAGMFGTYAWTEIGAKKIKIPTVCQEGIRLGLIAVSVFFLVIYLKPIKQFIYFVF